MTESEGIPRDRNERHFYFRWRRELWFPYHPATRTTRYTLESFLTGAPIQTKENNRDASRHSVEEETRMLREAVNILMLSPTFKAMIETHPALKNIPVMFVEETIDTGAYNPEVGEMHLGAHSDLYKNKDVYALASVMAHEYRHGWHDLKDIIQEPENLTVLDAMMLNRAIEADALSFQATICWELKQAGFAQAWEDLLAKPMYTDVFAPFKRQWSFNDNPFQDGSAQNQIYQAWFQSDRVRTNYDLAGLMNYGIYERRRNPRAAFLESNAMDFRLSGLRAMPWIQDDGSIVERPDYLSSQRIGDLRGPAFAIRHEELEMVRQKLDSAEGPS